MSRKRTQRGRGSRAGASSAENGAIARAVDHAFDNPAMSGGLLVMALTATAIVTNAMFLQTQEHPEPLFMTRPPDSLTNAAPTPNPAPGATATAQPGAMMMPPSPSLAPVSEPAAANVEVAGPVTEIQRELARLGLYVGEIDGIAGSRTRMAIAAYETAAGREVTATPSVELLQFMKSAPPPTEAQTAAVASPSATIAEESQVGPEPQSMLNRRVQTALNQAGYGPIAVDGDPGSETTDAIRRFELDNGLPITGKIGDRLIARLVAVGAMGAP